MFFWKGYRSTYARSKFEDTSPYSVLLKQTRVQSSRTSFAYWNKFRQPSLIFFHWNLKCWSLRFAKAFLALFPIRVEGEFERVRTKVASLKKSILSGRAGAGQQLATSYRWFAVFLLVSYTLLHVWTLGIQYKNHEKRSGQASTFGPLRMQKFI